MDHHGNVGHVFVTIIYLLGEPGVDEDKLVPLQGQHVWVVLTIGGWTLFGSLLFFSDSMIVDCGLKAVRGGVV